MGHVEVEEMGGVVEVWWASGWLEGSLKGWKRLKRGRSKSVWMSICSKLPVCHGQVREVC